MPRTRCVQLLTARGRPQPRQAPPSAASTWQGQGGVGQGAWGPNTSPARCHSVQGDACPHAMPFSTDAFQHTSIASSKGGVSPWAGRQACLGTAPPRPCCLCTHQERGRADDMHAGERGAANGSLQAASARLRPAKRRRGTGRAAGTGTSSPCWEMGCRGDTGGDTGGVLRAERILPAGGATMGQWGWAPAARGRARGGWVGRQEAAAGPIPGGGARHACSTCRSDMASVCTAARGAALPGRLQLARAGRASCACRTQQ